MPISVLASTISMLDSSVCRNGQVPMHFLQEPKPFSPLPSRCTNISTAVPKPYQPVNHGAIDAPTERPGNGAQIFYQIGFLARWRPAANIQSGNFPYRRRFLKIAVKPWRFVYQVAISGERISRQHFHDLVIIGCTLTKGIVAQQRGLECRGDQVSQGYAGLFPGRHICCR